MEITNIKTAFVEEAIESAGLPFGVDNKIRIETLKKLSKAKQRSHAKFLRQMMICATIRAPLYWWIEFDTYKIGVTRMSTSVMHTLLKTGLSFDDFDSKELFAIKKDVIEDINKQIANKCLSDIDKINYIKASLPGGFLYISFVTMNYEVLRTIYHDRKGHKLFEWKYFLDYFVDIPYFTELIL